MPRECPPPDPCGPKCFPLFTQNIPNLNRSHVHADAYLEDCRNKMAGAGDTDLLKPICGGCYDIPGTHQRSCECQECVCKREAVLEEECPQHTEGNRWQDLGRKFRDPDVQAMYDRLSSSEGAKSNLRWCPTDEDLPCVLRRFRSSNTGYLGQARVHYGAAQDCDYPKALVHGVVDYDITPGGKLINPPPKPWVQQLETDLAESIYDSNKTAPIGSSHDQLLKLPAHVHPDKTIFGIPTSKDVKASDLVNPKKDRFFVAAESDCCHPLYRKTHSHYYPGEQVCRNYEAPFKRSDTFGDLTPHDIVGRPCRQVISTWRQCIPDPPVVSKVYADHVDQRIPKLGKAQDRICGFRDRGPNYLYGKITPKDRPVDEIVFNRCPNEGAEKAKRLVHNLTEWVTKVRQNLKSDRGAELESLYEAFKANDKDCNGTIDWESFMRCLIEERVPRTLEPLDFIESLAYIGIFHPSPCNVVDYNLLMDFIKGHKEAQFASKVTTLKPYYLPHTNSCIHFRTTYSDFAANKCVQESCLRRAKEERINGMPSIRKDKVPARIRSTKDTTNYGDDGDAYSLIWPSVYTVRGVTARDVFSPMTQEQMRRVLCKAGINVTHEMINCAWEEALKMDPDDKGRVCFQSFREALDKVQKDQLDAMGLTYETEIQDCCPPPSKNCIPQPCKEVKGYGKPNPCYGP